MKDPAKVFAAIVNAMELDNNCDFPFSQHDVAQACPHVNTLLAHGYFDDNWDHIDSDIWQVAAGEATEVLQRFSKTIESKAAYNSLSTILDNIFNGENYTHVKTNPIDVATCR